MAALAQELGLTLIPMDDCKLLGNDGKSVPEAMDQRIQRLWNRVLDQCAEKQRKGKTSRGGLSPSVGTSGDDSRGETSEESHGEGSSSAESDAAEREEANCEHPPATANVDSTLVKTTPVRQLGREPKEPATKKNAGGSEEGRVMLQRPAKSVKASTRVSLGKVLEETARDHLVNFSTAEMEVWNWHRGNLEISCGAVSRSERCLGDGHQNNIL